MNGRIDSVSVDVAVPTYRRGYEEQVDELVLDVIRTVDHEMRGKPPHMVYEMLTILLGQRLPGIDVDEEAMRGVAAQIAFGLWAA